MPKRAHGKHNQLVCNHLNLQSNITCTDWIITTAFYSAIHYLDHILFPLKYNGTTVFNNINEAHKILGKESKHQTRSILVGKFLPQHDVGYNFLKSECWNARYYNYNAHEITANKAVRELNKIIKDCDKEKK